MIAVHASAPGLIAAGFAHGFSLPPRRFEVSPDGDAHAAMAASVGYPCSALRMCRQVHGARVLIDPSPDASVGEQADALVLRDGRGAAAVRTADCASILLGDKASGAVAAVHAGWRGVVAGVIPAAVAALAGGATHGVLAALGPGIGACCFEVGDEVAEAIVRACGEAVARPGPRGRPHVDLGAAVRAQLAACGIVAVEQVGGCTVCDPAGWHSFRRDGDRSGRMLAAIVAPER